MRLLVIVSSPSVCGWYTGGENFRWIEHVAHIGSEMVLSM